MRMPSWASGIFSKLVPDNAILCAIHLPVVQQGNHGRPECHVPRVCRAVRHHWPYPVLGLYSQPGSPAYREANFWVTFCDDSLLYIILRYLNSLCCSDIEALQYLAANEYSPLF
jgi:hypothetical protein